MKTLQALVAIANLIASLVTFCVAATALIPGQYDKAAAYFGFSIALWLSAHDAAKRAGLEDA